MIKSIIVFLCVFLSGIGSHMLLAQSGSLTSGGDGSGGGGSVSYSVGLPVYESSGSNFGIVTAGLQHATISVVTGEYSREVSLKAEVYPNPTADLLTLSLHEGNPADYRFVLKSLSGVEIQSEVLNHTITTISLETLAGSTFLLSVFKDNHVVKTFKILKNF